MKGFMKQKKLKNTHRSSFSKRPLAPHNCSPRHDHTRKPTTPNPAPTQNLIHSPPHVHSLAVVSIALSPVAIGRPDPSPLPHSAVPLCAPVPPTPRMQSSLSMGHGRARRGRPATNMLLFSSSLSPFTVSRGMHRPCAGRQIRWYNSLSGSFDIVPLIS